LEHTWSTLGPHLEHTWSTLGPHLEHTWTTLGAHLEHTWSTLGAHLGPHLNHTWTTLGLMVIRSRSAQSCSNHAHAECISPNRYRTTPLPAIVQQLLARSRSAGPRLKIISTIVVEQSPIQEPRNSDQPDHDPMDRDPAATLPTVLRPRSAEQRSDSGLVDHALTMSRPTASQS